MQVKIGAILLIFALSPWIAQAELGGKADSVNNDQVRLKASLRVNDHPLYSVHQLNLPSGTLVNEYLNNDGIVFALNWSGPTLPNLQQLLGANNFADYKTALAEKPHAGRGPAQLNKEDLVIHSGGHSRAFSGFAYVPSLLPEGFDLEAIK